jgi:hypothetical protein
LSDGLPDGLSNVRMVGLLGNKFGKLSAGLKFGTCYIYTYGDGKEWMALKEVFFKLEIITLFFLIEQAHMCMGSCDDYLGTKQK